MKARTARWLLAGPYVAAVAVVLGVCATLALTRGGEYADVAYIYIAMLALPWSLTFDWFDAINPWELFVVALGLVVNALLLYGVGRLLARRLSRGELPNEEL